MPAHGADPRPHRLAVLSCAIFILGVRDLPQAGRLGGRRERPRKADRPWSSGHSFLQPLLRFDELRDWLPKFMYELWMVELASMYGAHGQVWTSHEEYLNSYSTNYSEMWDFFRRIHELASRQGDDDSPPSAEVQTFVKSWRKALSWWQTDQSPRRRRTHPRLRDPRAPVGPRPHHGGLPPRARLLIRRHPGHASQLDRTAQHHRDPGQPQRLRRFDRP